MSYTDQIKAIINEALTGDEGARAKEMRAARAAWMRQWDNRLPRERSMARNLWALVAAGKL